MGIGVGLLDFVGGAADSIKDSMDKQLQEEADEKKAKLLAKIQADEAAAKEKAQSEKDRRKQDHEILRQSIKIEADDTRAQRAAEAAAEVQRQRSESSKYASDQRYKGSVDSAAIRAQQAIDAAERKRKEKGSEGGVVGWLWKMIGGGSGGNHPF